MGKVTLLAVDLAKDVFQKGFIRTPILGRRINSQVVSCSR